ncbi:MSMEG_0569 family flavin-dependent oxidoreductase [Mesorhizobium loti]|uniref:MSMEG_0569 family flavin-dependent oxidoreductase n=1 Tax=Mesorhizobium loti R88b TaxID=935548 RepID=A0A6M7WQU1_RHILI|nr:MSMEG_0569 family flavin-dependent oxidoreductase [Mesorhizobium loti]QKD04447.1 MSMEG_0569 family flavin-dependent oxidoreductase [Mesorhizobium loti R88b]
MAIEHHTVVVVGGSQAGLSASWCLKQRGIDHVVFEKDRVATNWLNQRWDAFCLVTPNWQCTLPGFSYDREFGGRDPDGFMLRDEIIAYIQAYRARFDPPLREQCGVRSVKRQGSAYAIETDEGSCTADFVIIATGGYHRPKIPRSGGQLPADILQLHSSTYRNARQTGDGAVLVIGTGQSGCQIAEDLHLEGKKVHLAVGSAPRAPRNYRGRDVTSWLVDMGHYALTVDDHPQKEGVRRKANHYMTGRDGGREIDLRRFACEGMALHGRLKDISGAKIGFENNLAANLDNADATAARIKTEIDKWIAEHGIDAPVEAPYVPVWTPGGMPPAIDLEQENIRTVIWATGFSIDYGWLDVPVLDDSGYPDHWRGVSKRAPNLYFLGLPWLWTWGSGRFSGVGQDAAYIVACIAEGRSGLERRIA